VPGEGASPAAPPPQYQTPQSPAYGTPPPTSGGGYPPPTSGGGYGQPGAYGQPPGGGYPPQGGYGAPGAYGMPGAVPAGYANNEDKTWALVAHFGGALGAFIGGGAGGWIAPLVSLLARGNQSPTVRAHSIAALNFQILWTIIAIIGWVTACLVFGIFIGIAAWLIATIIGVIAGVKANEGTLYKYPMSVNMIK
jgi:uncharacterized Tic20 family protein